MPNYESHVATYLRTAPSALSIFMSPLIEDQRIQLKWTKYATSHQSEACDTADGIFKESGNEAFLQEAIARSEEDRRKRIFVLQTDGTLDDDWSNASKLPLWQISCPRRHTILWNVKALPELEDVLNHTILEMGVPQISPFLPSYAVDFIHAYTFMFNPIVEGNNSLLGVTGMEVDWSTIWRKIELFEGTAVRVVLRNSCQPDEARTYQIRHHELDNATVEFIGEGDLHDKSFDGMGYYSTSNEEFWNYLRSQSKFDKKDLDLVRTMIDESFCGYAMSVHLTEDYAGYFRSSAPLWYLAGVIFMFTIYGKLMEQRQAEVLANAAKSEAIVKSLFPAVVRDRLFGAEEVDNRRRSPLFPSSRHHITGRSTGDRYPENSVKNNLTNFLTTSNRQESYLGLDEEPIAEMFSNTTIMFADIAGFTAWSSEREPAKVFKLLETLYHEFDAIAKRLDVFKVETIGDCYVAVSGLPHPQKNHAKIMARFASEILTSATNLTQELDSVLGPGTSDLGMRVGLHSGAVTAGVLRGAKSRFQLFGDTVNTASRMESTGEMGKIQVSEITANLIVQSGKKHWLKEREGTISVKGKGRMKTFWVKVCQKCPKSPVTSSEFVPSMGNGQDVATFISSNNASDEIIGSSLWDEIPSNDESAHSKASLTVKEDRLIQWNVDRLMELLEKVVSNNELAQSQNISGPNWGLKKAQGPFETTIDNSSRDERQNPIDEVVEVITLPKFCARQPPRGKKNSVVLSDDVKPQMKEFVCTIASMYRDVPFHNFEHASHVTLSVYKLMKRIITPSNYANVTKAQQNEHSSELHFSTFGISSDPLTQFALLFAALIHDVDHTGVSNKQLAKEDAPIARTFHNKSVAEQNSVCLAWEILIQPKYQALQNCIFPDQSEKKRFRQLLVNAVMATDILDPDMLQLRKTRWDKAFAPSLSDPSLPSSIEMLDIDMNRKATIVIEHIIQASDVAHTMQHWHIFIKWNIRLYGELYRAYKSGRADTDPTIGWYEGQIKFFDGYVIPLAKKLKECGVFGVSGDEYLSYAEMNRDEWSQKGREETRKMIQRTKLYEEKGKKGSHKFYHNDRKKISPTSEGLISSDDSAGTLLTGFRNGRRDESSREESPPRITKNRVATLDRFKRYKSTPAFYAKVEQLFE
eukprot:CAMPEP_0178933288 /NCGR_PEP_ID=MMETSP0786-20121207/23175_1 /TAXON_ID=186022 /ORGANISM="Thalassionema frauenfeldii, Strain CCMP 1798" /LENGTH=1147 /DNA_ID=CAMNT_0020610845 /DNA_START=214 /DNA_END=3662 /DNA_ORIENTATION=+